MIDRIIEKAVPWGIFIGLGALIGAAFPRETRAATRKAMLTGFRAADWVQGMSAEALEKGQDVFAEARLEYEQMVHEAERDAERGRLRVVQHPASRRRSSSQATRRRRSTSGSTSQA